MDRLPPEIKLIIIGYIGDDVKALSACALVNREWRPLAQTTLFNEHPMHSSPPKDAAFLATWSRTDCEMPDVRRLSFTFDPLSPGGPRALGVHLSEVRRTALLPYLCNLAMLYIGPKIRPGTNESVAPSDEYIIGLPDLGVTAYRPSPSITHLTLYRICLADVRTLQVLLRSLPGLEYLCLHNIRWLPDGHKRVDTDTASMPLRRLLITDEQPTNHLAYAHLYSWLLRIPAAHTLEEVYYDCSNDRSSHDLYPQFVLELSNIPGTELDVTIPDSVIIACTTRHNITVLPFGPRVTALSVNLNIGDPNGTFDLQTLSHVSAPDVQVLTLVLFDDKPTISYVHGPDCSAPPLARFDALDVLVLFPLQRIKNICDVGRMLDMLKRTGQGRVRFEVEGEVELSGQVAVSPDDATDEVVDVDGSGGGAEGTEE